MKKFVATLLFLAMSCIPSTPLPMNPSDTTICIYNETSAMGDLRVWDAERGGRLYTIMSGDFQCRRFDVNRSRVYLFGQTIGGSMWGPTTVEAEILLTPGQCLEWKVYNNMSSNGINLCRRS